MRLLVLYHVVLYQVFLVRGQDVVAASPEEIARREPDGDHILQEESHSSGVLLAPDGEVTAAAVRRAEALRYPNKKPDKFRELMEETDIREIHRVIVPPLKNNTENVIHKQDTKDNQIIQTVTTQGAAKTTQESITTTTPKYEITTNKISSNRGIKFESKDQQIKTEPRTNVAPELIVNKKENTKASEIVKQADQIENRKIVSTTENIIGKRVDTQNVAQLDNTRREQVNIQSSITKTPNTLNINHIPTTTEENQTKFSFQNQPIVVEDVTLPEIVKKPSVELEVPNFFSKPIVESPAIVTIKPPSVDLEAPLEDKVSAEEKVTHKIPETTSTTTKENLNTETIPTVIDLLRSSIQSIQRGDIQKDTLENIKTTTSDQKIELLPTEQSVISSIAPETIITSQQKKYKPIPAIKIPSVELESPEPHDSSKFQPNLVNKIKSESTLSRNGEIIKDLGQQSHLENSKIKNEQQTLPKISNQSHEPQREVITHSIKVETPLNQPYRGFESSERKTIKEAGETLGLPNERKNVLLDVLNTPTQNQNGVHNTPAIIPEERQTILGSALVNTLISSQNNVNLQNNDKQRTEILKYVKENPLCAQALEYFKLTRPQLLFQIYISMAPVFDTITKALHTEPSYAQSYNDYYLNTPIVDEYGKEVRNTQAANGFAQRDAKSERNFENFEDQPRHRRCSKTRETDVGLGFNMPIAEALYRRQNVQYENRENA